MDGTRDGARHSALGPSHTSIHMRTSLSQCRKHTRRARTQYHEPNDFFAHANNALNPSAFMEHQTLPWASVSKHEQQNVKPVQVRALVDNQTLHPCILEHLRSTKTLHPCRFEQASRIWTDKGRAKAHLDTVARIQNVSQTEIKRIRCIRMRKWLDPDLDSKVSK